MSGLIDVNCVRKSVINLGSLLAAIDKNEVFDRRFSAHVKKAEVNIAIRSTGDDNMIIRNLPLFDDQDVANFKSDKSCCKYLCFGCCTVSLIATLHERFLEKYGKDVKGRITLFDSTFRNFDEGIIERAEFDLSGRVAHMVTYPNHYIPLTDPNFQRRFCVLLQLNPLNVEEGTEIFNLCLGWKAITCNTMNATNILNRQSYEIIGTKVDTLEKLMPGTVDMIMDAFGPGLPIEKAGNDEFIKPRKSLKNKLLRTPRTPIKRRNYQVPDFRSGPTKIELTELGREAFNINRPKLSRCNSGFSKVGPKGQSEGRPPRISVDYIHRPSEHPGIEGNWRGSSSDGCTEAEETAGVKSSSEISLREHSRRRGFNANKISRCVNRDPYDDCGGDWGVPIKLEAENLHRSNNNLVTEQRGCVIEDLDISAGL
uniref:Movement protein n=1 Tax=Darwin betaflexivirus 1 TaxID=2201304 RepID=A0A2U8JQD3_9VIRU|nr:movement protein [Darwin betaflexivirus 1]